MTGKDGYESLLGRFNIERIDISTRYCAAVHIDGKVYCAKEHSVAVRQLMSANPQVENRLCFLHFIRTEGKLIAFIDCVALFGQPIIEVVAQDITEQLTDVAEIYEYRHPNRIRQIIV